MKGSFLRRLEVDVDYYESNFCPSGGCHGIKQELMALLCSLAGLDGEEGEE
jgi:hypothetical protein